MKPHVKNYMKFFGYGEQDIILCACCSAIAVDLHHIHIKGMGGRKTYEYNGETLDIDGVKNIIALCRNCHNRAHGGTFTKNYLYKIHYNSILKHGKS